MYQYELIESSLSDLLPILNSYILKEAALILQDYLSTTGDGNVYEDICDMLAFYKILIYSDNYQSNSNLGV